MSLGCIPCISTLLLYVTFAFGINFYRKKKKRIPSVPASPLLLEGHPLDQVHTFKYLGVLLSHDLSWSEHVHFFCNKAIKLLGLLYRRFYNDMLSDSLLQLYIFLVRPHLEYASVVWSLHLKKDKDSLGKIQKFACRMATRSWEDGYLHLLYLVDLPSLECRRLQARLSLLYKIIYKLCYFNESIFIHNTSATHHVHHNLVLSHPFARTNTYIYSFVPHSIYFWNNLDSSFVCSSSVSASYILPHYCNFLTFVLALCFVLYFLFFFFYLMDHALY